MVDSSDSLPSDATVAGPESQQVSRLLWWLHPKVALPLALILVILFSPFMYRGYRIASVPDIGDPFDVEAFGTVEIPPIENAMTQYAAATLLLRKGTYPSEDLEKAFEQGWSEASEVLRKWLDDNQPALTEWRKGTGRSQAVLVQPKDFRFDTILDVIQDAREFSRLAALQAERFAHEGDLEAAWDWLLAAVRASRHVEQNGCLIQRLVGIAMFYNAADGINRWSQNPAVTTDMLQKALADFREADQLTPPNSVAMKTEYLVLLNTLRNAKSLHELFDGDVGISGQLQTPALFVMGEPELSLRVFQHVFCNQLLEIDKLKRERAPTAPGAFSLYDLPSGAAPCLPSAELERVIHSALLARMTLPAYVQTDIAMQNEAVKRAAVSLMLACQLHHRSRGDWPTKVEDLVPESLAEPPADPLGKSHELLRLKREGDDLVIYSVGPNGIDDGGNIGSTGSSSTSEHLDQGYRLKRPVRRENSPDSDTAPKENP